MVSLEAWVINVFDRIDELCVVVLDKKSVTLWCIGKLFSADDKESFGDLFWNEWRRFIFEDILDEMSFNRRFVPYRFLFETEIWGRETLLFGRSDISFILFITLISSVVLWGNISLTFILLSWFEGDNFNLFLCARFKIMLFVIVGNAFLFIAAMS